MVYIFYFNNQFKIRVCQVLTNVKQNIKHIQNIIGEIIMIDGINLVRSMIN